MLGLLGWIGWVWVGFWLGGLGWGGFGVLFFVVFLRREEAESSFFPFWERGFFWWERGWRGGGGRGGGRGGVLGG